MRLLVILFILLIPLYGCKQANEPKNEIIQNDLMINLDSDKVLQHLASSNPKHYESIMKILNQIHNKEPENIKNWLRIDFNISESHLADMQWLASDPPKKRLEFVLDSTSYKLTFSVKSEAKAMKLH